MTDYIDPDDHGQHEMLRQVDAFAQFCAWRDRQPEPDGFWSYEYTPTDDPNEPDWACTLGLDATREALPWWAVMSAEAAQLPTSCAGERSRPHGRHGLCRTRRPGEPLGGAHPGTVAP